MKNSHGIALATLFIVSLFFTAPATAQYCEAVGCGYCGDGVCSYGEEWCTADCSGGAYCGDYICSPELGEDRYSCTTDCVCGDGVCSYGEDSNYCPGDCPPPPACVADTCTSCGQPAFGDYDGDAVPDKLEYDLAHKFFPNIMLQTYNDDLAQTYLYNGKAIPYTVHAGPVSGLCNETFKCLEIRFGTAYFNDIGAAGHNGDSEFYAALVMRTTSWSSAQLDADQWQIFRDFTAAHWTSFFAESSRYGAYGYCSPNCHAWDNDQNACFSHGSEGSGCGWMSGQCLGSMNANYTMPCSWYEDEGSCYFAGGSCHWMRSQCIPNAIVCDQSSPLSSPPTLYASKGKHGLYHNTFECDNGGFNGYDNCDVWPPPYNMRSYTDALLQNIGEVGSHGGFDAIIQGPDNCYLNNVWDADGFGGSTPYKKHFTYSFGWPLN
jgi:hypothetical protein